MRGVSWSFGLKIGSVLVVLLVNILLARSLGPDRFGSYAYILAVIGLLSIPTTLGLPELLVRDVAKYRVQRQWPLLKGLLVRANQSVAALALVIGAFSAAVAAFLAWPDKGAFFIALPLLVVNSLSSLRDAAMRGLRYVILAQLPELAVRPLLFLILISALVLAGRQFSVVEVFGLQLMAASAAFGAGTWLLMSRLPPQAKTAHSEYRTGAWLKGAIPFLFLGAMYFITNQTDIVMLGLMRSSAEVGIYKIAVQGAQLVIFILIAVNTTIGPLISELYHSGDLAKLKRVAVISARVIALVSVPIALVFMTFGRPLVDLVFGADYASASGPLAVLCLGQVVNAGMGSVGLILNMTGHERDTLKAVGLAALLNIILNAALIPKFGIDGAAWATTVSMVIWNVILSGMVFKRLGFWVSAVSRV